MNFEERFKGKLSHMNKGGFNKILSNTINPINRDENYNINNFNIKENSQRCKNFENIQRNYLNYDQTEIYAKKIDDFSQNKQNNINYQIPEFSNTFEQNNMVNYVNYDNNFRNEYYPNNNFYRPPPMLMKPHINLNENNRGIRTAENILNRGYRMTVPNSAKNFERNFTLDVF